ncbi:MAG: hypothetical protein HQ523_07305 [Lentisphaerae bacterium]|nr:hypothetical protein [Lentisphaerota bacterium]
MRLLEHQAKKLLEPFGLPFTHGVVIREAGAVVSAIASLTPSSAWVLKAQVPFGGRGKAGAIRFVTSEDEAVIQARELFALRIRDTAVHAVSIEPRMAFSREFYVGVAWDTAARLPVAILSLAGGVDVEASSEHQVVRRTFDPGHGLSPYEGREMAEMLHLTGKTLTALGTMLHRLAAAFVEVDALTLEINPLIETDNGALLGLDAHLEIEDDALARQQDRLGALGELVASPTGREPTPLELEAQRIDAMDHRGVAGRVVEFDGDLALLIGGGGASLTVFDAVRRHGGRPANYCEVGGNPTEEKVAALTALLLSKPGVVHLAVIMNVVNNTRADVMARGVVDGVRQAGREPAETITVFRIPGSWEPEASAIMAEAGVHALGRDVSLDEAARLAVERSGTHVA